MHYSIFLGIAALILAPAVGFTSFTQVTVSFRDGRYDPSAVSYVGGKLVEEFQKVGMVKAVVPRLTIPLLELNNNVDFVEQDGQVSTLPANSSDVSFSNTSNASESSSNWGVAAIGAVSAHQQGFEGTGVKVAVLDTGIDYKHPDLAASYRGGYDFVNNDNDPMDDNGHGTHVAGIIAAANNTRGVVGVAPNASLYAVKISDSAGKGTFSLLVQGINWAIENHMDIITMSITGADGSSALAKAVTIAHDKYGIVLVAAVGNGSGGGVLYPAQYGPVIAVGAVNRDDSLASFSLTGRKVEIVAPGLAINSTWPENKYKVMSGTSMATPFVTGTIALILASDERIWTSAGLTDGDGKWTPDEVRNVLDHMTKHLGADGRNEQFGFGVLQLTFPKKEGNSTDTSSASNSSVIARTHEIVTTARPLSFLTLGAHFFS